MPLKNDLEGLAKARALALELIFLSSSTIALQINHQAPCDALILADSRWQAELLQAAKVFDPKLIIGSNHLVIASRREDSSHDAREILLNNRAQKLIIGDPDHVPLGVYTKEALAALGAWDDSRHHFVLAASARQAALLLKHGAAERAVLFHSDAVSEGFFISAHVDERLHRPIKYHLLFCKNASEQNVVALKKLFFADEMPQILSQHGFLERP